MKQTITLTLNKFQLGILATYAGNELDQIYERKQQGSFEIDDNLEALADALIDYGTTDYDEALSWTGDLHEQILIHLVQATRALQEFEFNLGPEQISLLRNYVLYAQGNLRDRRGSDWDIMTEPQAKLEEFGTTEYAQAMALLAAIDQQIPDETMFGIAGSTLQQVVTRFECVTNAMGQLINQQGIFSQNDDLRSCLLQGQTALQILKKLMGEDEEG